MRTTCAIPRWAPSYSLACPSWSITVLNSTVLQHSTIECYLLCLRYIYNVVVEIEKHTPAHSESIMITQLWWGRNGTVRLVSVSEADLILVSVSWTRLIEVMAKLSDVWMTGTSKMAVFSRRRCAKNVVFLHADTTKCQRPPQVFRMQKHDRTNEKIMLACSLNGVIWANRVPSGIRMVTIRHTDRVREKETDR